VGCRVLLSKPKLVLMDEATSALDIDNEERLYKAVNNAGVTFVSVGHRPTLAAYHARVLRLSPVDSGMSGSNATWELADSKEMKLTMS
jgi:putative ATP-binding cassette transporter